MYVVVATRVVEHCIVWSVQFCHLLWVEGTESNRRRRRGKKHRGEKEKVPSGSDESQVEKKEMDGNKEGEATEKAEVDISGPLQMEVSDEVLGAY